MSSSELGYQRAPASSREQQWDSVFNSNYTSTTSPVDIDRIVPMASEPSDWLSIDDSDLGLDLTFDLTITCSYDGIVDLSLENDFSPAEPAPPEIGEPQQQQQQQQQVPSEAPTNLPDATPNATRAEPAPTAENDPSKLPINGGPAYGVKKAKEPVRPWRVRIKEGKAPRHACHVEGCSKDFSRREHLRRHLKAHSGAKPYVCDWPSCAQNFTRKETLERHKEKHSGDARFACNVCGKHFKRNDCMKLHRARMHGGAKSRAPRRVKKGKKSEDDSCGVEREAAT